MEESLNHWCSGLNILNSPLEYEWSELYRTLQWGQMRPLYYGSGFQTLSTEPWGSAVSRIHKDTGSHGRAARVTRLRRTRGRGFTAEEVIWKNNMTAGSLKTTILWHWEVPVSTENTSCCNPKRICFFSHIHLSLSLSFLVCLIHQVFLLLLCHNLLRPHLTAKILVINY